MADQTPPEQNQTDTTTKLKPAEAAARIAALEKELAESKAREGTIGKELADLRGRFQREWDERERAFADELRRVKDEQAASAPPTGPRWRPKADQVVVMKANHGLCYTDREGKPQRVRAGAQFRASIDELTDDKLNEGDAFEVVGPSEADDR
jgi:hypothetical protein